MEDVNSTEPELFPFDGECEGSKDADLTLLLPNNTKLKAHSCLLSMLSPVLRTAIEECSHEKVLNLEKDDPSAWLHMLNLLHPLKSIVANRFVKANSLSQMNRLAGLAEKYSIAHVHNYLDEAVSEYINGVRLAKLHVSASNGNVAYCQHSYRRGYCHLCRQMRWLEEGDEVVTYTVFSVRYNMDKTNEACRQYLRDSVMLKETFQANGQNQKGEGMVIGNLIMELSSAGFSEAGCSLAADLFRLLA